MRKGIFKWVLFFMDNKNKNEHYYVSVNDTKQFGIIQAAILGRIKWWCQYNKEKGIKNRFLDGFWWSGYLSARELSEQIGLSPSTVDKNITKLLEIGILVKGNYNKKGFDRTRWFRINDEYVSLNVVNKLVSEENEFTSEDDLMTQEEIELSSEENSSILKDETIPINISNKKNNNAVNNTYNKENLDLLSDEIFNKKFIPIVFDYIKLDLNASIYEKIWIRNVILNGSKATEEEKICFLKYYTQLEHFLKR